MRVYMSRITTGQRSDVGGTARNRQPSDSDVVHDHIRLRQHQIGAIACSQFSSGGASSEMISGGGADANGKVSVEGVGEHLLPSA